MKWLGAWLLVAGVFAAMVLPVFALGWVVCRVAVRRWPRPRAMFVPIGIVAILLVSPYALSAFGHDARLRHLMSDICEGRRPAGSEVLSCSGEVGLMSNGNHCDYQVSIGLRTSWLPIRVTAFYRGISAPSWFTDGGDYEAEPIVSVADVRNGSVRAQLEWDGGPATNGNDLRCT